MVLRVKLNFKNPFYQWSNFETEICMIDCCNTCCYKYILHKADYSHGGCEHNIMDGFICMAFADENIAEWMVGTNPNSGLCECYEPKKQNVIKYDG